jgi:hypothetical protein
MQYVDIAKQALALGHRGYKYIARGRRKNNSSRTTVCTEYICSVSLSSGLASLTLDDASMLSTDLADLGDIYRYFKFKKITLEFPSPGWSTAGHLAVLFVPSASSSYPSFDNAEAPKVALISATQTVPTRMTLTADLLHGALPWYMSNGAATDPSLEQQGIFRFVSRVSSTETIYFKVIAECEFKDLLDPSTISANLLKRSKGTRLTGAPSNKVQASEATEERSHQFEYVRIKKGQQVIIVEEEETSTESTRSKECARDDKAADVQNNGLQHGPGAIRGARAISRTQVTRFRASPKDSTESSREF